MTPPRKSLLTADDWRAVVAANPDATRRQIATIVRRTPSAVYAANRKHKLGIGG
jgi:hypothetical protein